MNKLREDGLEIIIGLEVHVQLKTETKLFCACRNGEEGALPNTNICPTCLGIVGALPLINGKAIEYTVKTGIATLCTITPISKWDRKNYFYPDLPKGYQISQFDAPLAHDGKVSFIGMDGNEKSIRLNRIHLEEDAAKLVHTNSTTLVDFNRGGIPLMEIVTEPDIRSVEDAESFLRELRRIVRYLEVSDADLEKGHLRCDASISLRRIGETALYPRTEIKNLNSFKMVKSALTHEYEKQKALWLAGTIPDVAQTVLWNDILGRTYFMRDKEGASDYRYTPEPDILEWRTAPELVESIRKKIPTLPAHRIKKYLEHGISSAMAHTIAEEKETADFLDAVLSSTTSEKNLQILAVKSFLSLYPELNLSVDEFMKVVRVIHTKKISGLFVKDLWEKIKSGPVNIDELLSDFSTEKSDVDLPAIISETLCVNAQIVAEYKSGKEKALNVLIGKIVVATNRKVPVEEIVESLKKQLTN